jgi:hypothetical protein
MSAIEPAGEKIVRNLQQAVERLHEDIARVELWAGALGCFAKPIPDYGYGQTKFDLLRVKPASEKRPRNSELTSHRESASRSDSPSRVPGKVNPTQGGKVKP